MDEQGQAWFLKSKFPVFWPTCEGLDLPQEEFERYLTKFKNDAQLQQFSQDVEALERQVAEEKVVTDDGTDTFTLVSDQPSTTAEVRQILGEMDVDEDAPMDTNSLNTSASDESPDDGQGANTPIHNNPMDMPLSPGSGAGNKMLTENGAIAYRSTNNALLDLFTELEDVVSGPRLLELLCRAWNEDPLATLKIIFNARSIHLGKSSRHTFYRCAGWLAQYHPLTLVTNLQWLSRPVVEVKVPQKTKDDEDMVIVEPESDPDDRTRFDVRHGAAHGYWKDLLNILALSANGELDVLGNPREVLNIGDEDVAEKGQHRSRPRQNKTDVTEARHNAAIRAFTNNHTHHILHLTVARLFASQLQADLSLISKDSALEKREEMSLCAKWAPSLEGFHDKHTFIASSIAEIMFPPSFFPPLVVPQGDREVYLRHAREEYRRTLSALRTRLNVVEKDITAGTFADIHYDLVPSLAMRQYAPLFAEKDGDRFSEYLVQVKMGKKAISGAVLMPSVMVAEALAAGRGGQRIRGIGRGRGCRGGRDCRGGGRRRPALPTQQDLPGLVLDAQWNTLVQRVRDSGSLESCIAICDVSGSMWGPTFPDGTAPIHSAIGLSLLMAEVVTGPFGGAFIAFSSTPSLERINLKTTFREKVAKMEKSNWSMSTNLPSVFEDVILDMALKRRLAPEQMVKKVFIFSDMQFDAGTNPRYQSDTTFDIIKANFAKSGYEMPEVVFWNLAGGRAGFRPNAADDMFLRDPIAPKPVAMDAWGVAMVSGYSQGMMKVFMDKGMFDEEDVDGGEEMVMRETEDGEVVDVVKTGSKMDPVSLMRKAIGHKAYAMLKVVD